MSCDGKQSTLKAFPLLRQGPHYSLLLLGFVVGCGTAEDSPEAPLDQIVSANVNLGAIAWRLGGNHSPIIIGEVTDVELTDSGSVILLDGTTATLYRIDGDGHVASSFGRLGEGPGEFRSAKAIAHTNKNEIVVYDDELQRLTQLRLTPDMAVLRSSRIHEYLGSLCAVEAGMVSARFDPKTGKLVRLLNKEGKVLKTFGLSYLPREGIDPEVWRSMSVSGSQSRVACQRQINSIAYGSVLKALVRRTTVDGKQLWETRVEGLHLSRFEARGGRTMVGFEEADTVRDVMASLVFLDDDLLLAQFGRILQSNPWPGIDYVTITSVLLDARSGKEVGRQNDLPLIVASDGRSALTVVVDEDLTLHRREMRLLVDRKLQ